MINQNRFSNFNNTGTNVYKNNSHNVKNSYKKNKFQNIQCLNCGFYGHGIRTCNYPITSYGIMCYMKTDEKIKYLMIQRKDSLCYIELLRGKFDINNINYVQILFDKVPSLFLVSRCWSIIKFFTSRSLTTIGLSFVAFSTYFNKSIFP
mgnify:CR=1 FL=1